MVLKSGTNTPHGSTRIYFENEDMQSNNLSDDSPGVASAARPGKGNRMHAVQRLRASSSAVPIVKNRVWAWGAYGKTHVDLITLGGTHDRTELQDTSFKATGQITSGIRANFTYLPRRQAEVRPRRRLRRVRRRRPTTRAARPTLYKGEGNFVIGSNLFLAAETAPTSRAASSSTAEGGPDKQMVRRRRRREPRHGGYLQDGSPAGHVSVDGNSFSGHHELKFGFGWRKASVDSTDVYPGNGVITQHIGYPEMIAKITRPRPRPHRRRVHERSTAATRGR